MFGELIGLWAASVWQLMGEPENVRLVELGPGRGTLMLDVLRAAQVVPAFLEPRWSRIWSRSARRCSAGSRRTLQAIDVPLHWHQSFDEVPRRPGDRRRQRVLRRAAGASGGQADRRLARARGRDRRRRQPGVRHRAEPIPLFDQLLPAQLRDAPIGAIYEWRTDPLPLELGRRLARDGGAALVIDYGHVESAAGDTLQAVRRARLRQSAGVARRGRPHRPCRFPGARPCRRKHGRARHGPVDAGRVPAPARHRRARRGAKAHAQPEKAGEIDAAVTRLTGEGRAGMGRLFKVIGFADPKLGRLPGFETDRCMLQARSLSRSGRHPPRLLHPRGRRLGRRLRQPQRRHRLERQARARVARTAPAWRRRSACAPERFVTAYQIHSPDGGDGRSALGRDRPAARRRHGDAHARARARHLHRRLRAGAVRRRRGRRDRRGACRLARRARRRDRGDDRGHGSARRRRAAASRRRSGR